MSFEERVVELLAAGREHVEHGALERFPDFLRSDKNGALSSIEKLGQWPRFDIGYRDREKRYHQMNASGNSALGFYEMGALVRSSNIDETTPAARAWLEDWADLLGVTPGDLRLNSWAVRGPNGIDWHFDPEDVIHFQIKGDKRFKFLSSDDTRLADGPLKRLEKFLIRRQDFTQAREEVVREGTITIIPRGVWHWSESQSPESFAVSLCVNPPSYAWAVSQALYKKLRLIECGRLSVSGDMESQLATMDECLEQARTMLGQLTARQTLINDRRIAFSIDEISTARFFLNPAARFETTPLRMWMNERPLAIEGNDDHLSMLQKICAQPPGFVARDISVDDLDQLSEILISLVRVGFLDVV